MKRGAEQQVVPSQSKRSKSEKKKEKEEPITKGSGKSKGSYRNGRLDISQTGAREGDVLIGINENQTKGARLRCVSGKVDISQKEVDRVGKDSIVQLLSQWFSGSKARAADYFDSLDRDELPAHQPLGKSCTCDSRLHNKQCTHSPCLTFVIVQPGMLLDTVQKVGIGSLEDRE